MRARLGGSLDLGLARRGARSFSAFAAFIASTSFAFCCSISRSFTSLAASASAILAAIAASAATLGLRRLGPAMRFASAAALRSASRRASSAFSRSMPRASRRPPPRRRAPAAMSASTLASCSALAAAASAAFAALLRALALLLGLGLLDRRLRRLRLEVLRLDRLRLLLLRARERRRRALLPLEPFALHRLVALLRLDLLLLLHVRLLLVGRHPFHRLRVALLFLLLEPFSLALRLRLRASRLGRRRVGAALARLLLRGARRRPRAPFSSSTPRSPLAPFASVVSPCRCASRRDRPARAASPAAASAAAFAARAALARSARAFASRASTRARRPRLEPRPLLRRGHPLAHRLGVDAAAKLGRRVEELAERRAELARARLRVAPDDDLGAADEAHHHVLFAVDGVGERGERRHQAAGARRSARAQQRLVRGGVPLPR